MGYVHGGFVIQALFYALFFFFKARMNPTARKTIAKNNNVKAIIQWTFGSSAPFAFQLEKSALNGFAWWISFCRAGILTLIKRGTTYRKKLARDKITPVFTNLFVFKNRTSKNRFKIK